MFVRRKCCFAIKILFMRFHLLCSFLPFFLFSVCHHHKHLKIYLTPRSMLPSLFDLFDVIKTVLKPNVCCALRVLIVAVITALVALWNCCVLSRHKNTARALPGSLAGSVNESTVFFRLAHIHPSFDSRLVLFSALSVWVNDCFTLFIPYPNLLCRPLCRKRI